MSVKKLLYKVLSVMLMLHAISPAALGGDGDTKVTKTVSESFLVPSKGHLEIVNKYGQVVINNTNEDSVSIEVEIIAYGKDRDTANKILDRVDFDFTDTNHYLTLETVLDRKSGAFKELWNNIGDYSKTLLSKNKLVINYEVSVPKSLSLSVSNKFGDVFIPDRTKKVEIDMSHGNLRANRLDARCDISVSYGNTAIAYIQSGNLKLKISEADIKSLGNVDITSSSSEIIIRQAEDIELNSRSDRKVEITSASRLSGKMSFSKLRVEDVSKSVDLELSYSDIEVDHIPFSFSLVQIDGRSSDIDLTFDENTHMQVDIEGEEDKINLDYSALDKTYIDEKKGLVRYSGAVGKHANYKGNLSINTQRGSIDIRTKYFQQSVKSN